MATPELTEQAALNRWQRERLERWNTGMVRHQIERASFRSRDELERDYAALPEDEQAWHACDAAEVLSTLDLLVGTVPDRPVDRCVVAGVALAVERSFNLPAGTISSLQPDRATSSSDGGWTLAELRADLLHMASERDLPYGQLLAKAVAETQTAVILQTLRARQADYQRPLQATQALMLSPQPAGTSPDVV